MEREDAKGAGGVGGGDCCEEVGGVWGGQLGGEDCGPPVADGWGVWEELVGMLGDGLDLCWR